jgi:hypothetical protein
MRAATMRATEAVAVYLLSIAPADIKRIAEFAVKRISRRGCWPAADRTS